MFDLPETPDLLVRGIVLASLAVLWTLLLVRVVGLRAFSKMTAFDFVTTIATGSLIAQAATRSEWTEFLQALAAIGGIFLIQYLLAKARQHSDSFRGLIRNKPVLLMEHGLYFKDAMHQTRVSRSSIIEKLRASGVESIEKVRAVVLETTGDISVIEGEIDEELLEGVQRIGGATPG